MPAEPTGTDAQPAAGDDAPLPISTREIAAAGAMLALFVAAQALAILLTPSFQGADIQGFEDPEDWTNGLVLIGVILVFTAIILFIARKKKPQVIQWIILVAVGLTVAYVFFALLFNVAVLARPDLLTTLLGVAGLWILALVLAAVPTWLLYTFPEWYVVDLVGVLVAAGAVAIFGTSFTPLTYTVVLVGTAIYDYVSVHKTKHMLDLADNVLELHLPIMLVVPKSRGYSFLDEKGGLREKPEDDEPDEEERVDEGGHPEEEEKSVRDAMFLGLGDIVIPSILIVSALVFTGVEAAFGAFLGTIAGFLVLMAFVLRGKPQPGLPALNGGAFLGFLAGFWLATGSLAFWA